MMVVDGYSPLKINLKSSPGIINGHFNMAFIKNHAQATASCSNAPQYMMLFPNTVGPRLSEPLII